MRANYVYIALQGLLDVVQRQYVCQCPSLNAVDINALISQHLGVSPVRRKTCQIASEKAVQLRTIASHRIATRMDLHSEHGSQFAGAKALKLKRVGEARLQSIVRRKELCLSIVYFAYPRKKKNIDDPSYQTQDK